MTKTRICAVLLGDGIIQIQKEPRTEVKGWEHLAYERYYLALRAVSKKFGYSFSGIIECIGDNFSIFKSGNQVAAIGTHKAWHSDYVVLPQNLCISIPDEMIFSQGTYVMLLTTAIQSVQRGNPAIGEYRVASGLGILGFLMVRLLVLNGCCTADFNLHQNRLSIARKYGAVFALSSMDEYSIGKLKAFISFESFDGAVIAFSEKAEDTIDFITTKAMGRILDDHFIRAMVSSEWSEFSYNGGFDQMNNIDICRSSRLMIRCGNWGTGGVSFCFVRWTSLRNIAFLC